MNKLYAVFSLALLVGGCTRADTLSPTTTVNTGRYRFASHLVNCQAEAVADASYSPAGAVEILDVSLTPSESQVESYPSIDLEFKRPAGEPNAAYQLTHFVCLSGNGKPDFYYDDAEATIQETSSGVFTGTFSGTKPGEGAISEGSFTQVRAKPLLDN